MPFKKYEKSPVGALYMAKIKILKDKICNLTAHASRTCLYKSGLSSH
jgi:hypothetical protein